MGGKKSPLRVKPTSLSEKRLILFGAGMTGRGQVAQLAFEDGWKLTLVDRDARLVELLRQTGQYTVRLLGNVPRDVIIRGYQSLHTSDTAALIGAVQQADLVVTSVLEPNLPEVGKILAPALVARLQSGNSQPLNIIAAENMDHSSTDLQGYVRQHIPTSLLAAFERTLGFPNSMISRVVPIADDPLHILTEAYSEWTADLHQVVGRPPTLAGLEWVTNQTARLQRKLYIHNTGHVICGYLGWLGSYRYIHEAAQNPIIMGHIRAAITESGEAVSREHGFARAEVKSYEQHLLGRLIISEMPDDLRRVIRHPIRKLGMEERLLGPLRLCEKFDLPRAWLCYGVAAVLAGCKIPYDYKEYDDQSERVRKALEQAGPVQALRDLVGFQPTALTAKLIANAYDEVNARNI